MSLLLEALKKAEKAKEEAQRRARSEGGEAPAELSIEGEPLAPAADAKPVLTRDKLPEITSQPLEILPDEPQPAKPTPPRQKPEAPKAEPAAAAERASAKKVFEAKFREPNPRLPFYIAVGVLGAFAVGTVGYFWVQLRPPPPLVNANPVRPAGEAPVEVAVPPKPLPSAPVAQVAPVPGLPTTPKVQEPVRTPAPPPAELRPKPPVAKKPAVEAPRLAAPEPRQAPPPSRPVPQIHPRVEAGYAAYIAGDLVKARTDYEEALRDEPGNRDARLGLAALDVKAGRYEVAEAGYLRLLQANPRDAEAQAALIALRGGRLDPLVAESRVKSLLAAEPGAHVLHFTLGNQLAQQGRWAEAQAEYFKAFSAEPDNADFAYNLAVSLDHIRQPRLALEYYRRAIALAEKRGAGFDLAAARSRAAQLDK
ncbi:MAG: tetratricopeptide repeat protein [Betaproteobacteria bacterium]